MSSGCTTISLHPSTQHLPIPERGLGLPAGHRTPDSTITKASQPRFSQQTLDLSADAIVLTGKKVSFQALDGSKICRITSIDQFKSKEEEISETLLYHIFSYLKNQDINKCSRVCKVWSQVGKASLNEYQTIGDVTKSLLDCLETKVFYRYQSISNNLTQHELTEISYNNDKNIPDYFPCGVIFDIYNNCRFSIGCIAPDEKEENYAIDPEKPTLLTESFIEQKSPNFQLYANVVVTSQTQFANVRHPDNANLLFACKVSAPATVVFADSDFPRWHVNPKESLSTALIEKYNRITKRALQRVNHSLMLKSSTLTQKVEIPNDVLFHKLSPVAKMTVKAWQISMTLLF